MNLKIFKRNTLFRNGTKINKGYTLNQRLRIEKLARKFNLEYAKLVGNQIDIRRRRKLIAE